MEFKKYIDFNQMFLDLFRENEKTLEDHKYEADHFRKLLEFRYNEFEKFELEIDECEFGEKEIHFCFGYSHNDANESNNQSSWSSCYVTYDVLLEEFVNIEFDQG